MVRFLVVRFSSIGDIILTTPVVRHLKSQVDDAEIHYLTKETYVPLLKANPYIDRVHSYDGDMKSCLRELKAQHIDYIIDLHNNTRSARIKFGLKRMDFTVRKLNILKWLYVNFRMNRLPDIHLVDRYLETIRAFISERDQKGLDYFLSPDDRVPVSELPAGYREGFIGMAIGAKHETKKLPLDSLITLCKKLTLPVIILGGPDDSETGDAIVSALPDQLILNACGQYSVNQSASLVQQSLLLITHDTGLMHIGAAFGKKIITIWGNTVPAFGMYPYRADPSSVGFEVAGLACRPCSKIGYERCPKKHFKCMMEQDLDGIASAAKRLTGITAQ
jgi:ADP-heptose:LPS heptosyltransferase